MSSWPRISTAGWLIEPEIALPFHQPDVLKADGVAVALKVDLALFLFGAPTAGSRTFVEFVVVMDNDSVVPGGDAGVLHFLAVLETRGANSMS